MDFISQQAIAAEAPLATGAIAGSSPYEGYSYAYPHKTAYRRLETAVSLSEVWANESVDSLFLYLHIPFCEYRCGFCNLFTQANPEDGLTGRYLNQLSAEADAVAGQLSQSHSTFQFARIAIGGGTPTFLETAELERLFGMATTTMGADVSRAPTSVEVSPATISGEKLSLLCRYGVERISIGIQSFSDAEVHQLGRPQKTGEVEAALALIRDFPVPRLNIDLIYGGAGQTPETWLESINRALVYRPEEIYLYPLYVRPLTGLGQREWNWDDHRLTLYRVGRDALLEAGYRQHSMRMFARGDVHEATGPEYCCQTDGMIGIGCGARSYTRDLHYSTEYAVGKSGVQSIIADYIARDAAQFESACYGMSLTIEEQRRRFVIQSLLQASGMSLTDYRNRFGDEAFDHLPELTELEPNGLAVCDGEMLRLTPSGLERSDAIGPWLYSADVRSRMEHFELR